MKEYSHKRGFVRSIVAIVLAIIVLKYAFGLDILGLLNNPRFNSAFEKIYEVTMLIWNDYLLPAVNFVIQYAMIAGNFAWEWGMVFFVKLKEWGIKAYPEFLRFW